MIKLLSTLAVGIMSIGTIGSYKTDDISNVKNFFNQNLQILKAEYYKNFNIKWEVKSIENVKRIYNLNDNHIGYLIDFDLGYIAFGLNNELYKLEIDGEPEFYNHNNRLYYISKTFLEKKENNFYTYTGDAINIKNITGNGLITSDIFHEIDSALNNKNFQINASCTKIPQLKDKYDSSKWGNYQCVSFYQGYTTDCGVIAIMDLLYTYKLSGSVDYTKGKKPNEMREDLRVLTNWRGNIVGEGMLPLDLTRGCTNYIDRNNISLKGTGNYRDDVPEICLYFNLNIGNTAHFTMKVGSAQQDYWWIFKTYWDIVVSWETNYDTDSNGIPNRLYDSNSSYYLVDQQYRQGAYQLYDRNSLIF